jgi:hypothetical protein
MLPLYMPTSVPQIPTDFTFIMTSPAAGSGLGRFFSISTLGSINCIAFKASPP